MTPPLPFDPVTEAARLWREHGWADAADGMATVTSLMRAQAIVQARVDDVLRPLRLSFARYELLMLLSFTRSGALPMAKAGARLQVHPASVTNAASRLELFAMLPVGTDHETSARAWRETLMLARAQGLTTYDAAYLELAVRRGLPLATKDRALADAAKQMGVAVLP